MIDSAILVFLAALHCVPRAEVEIDPTLKVPGLYALGLVTLRAPNDAVLVHELWHDCQRRKLGPANTQAERERREVEAHYIQQLWTESR